MKVCKKTKNLKRIFALFMAATLSASGITLPVHATERADMAEGSWQTASVRVDDAYAEWDFDEGKGTTVADKNGQHNGTLNGGMSWVAGKDGTGLSFDGNGYVDFGIGDLSSTWTASMWVKKGSCPEDNAVLLSGSEGEIKLEQYENTKKVGLTKFGVADDTFNYTAPEGEWVHLAFASNGASTSLYVNGEESGTINQAIQCPATRIGANDKSGMASAGYLKAVLDEVKIFNRVLTAEEVAELAVDDGVPTEPEKPVDPEEPELPGNDEAPAAHGPVPSERQLQYNKDERAAFIHFGVNTFTGREWGDGKENPAVFNPTELDPDQWARVLKEAGFKKIIITAKHHDGFNLFDSPGTDHDITNAAIDENVRGRDVVKELSEACKKYGLKFGVYYSPWDQNSEHYGNDRGEDYNTYFMNALTKLLTEYGEISEVWFDGAKGSGVQQDYYFDQWFALVKELQPNALIFSDMGPDVRWIGNEAGYAGEPCWSKIKGDTLTLPEYDTNYLNHGDPEGTHWIMGESDTSIRGGWFFHQEQQPKSLDKLVDIYFNSVGKNSTLLLNVPPNKKGLIEDADVARLREFNEVLANSFETDMAFGKTAAADSYRGETLGKDTFAADNVTDGDYDTYWTTDNGVHTGSVTIDLEEETVFDIIDIQEYIPLGQRIQQFSVDVYNDNLGEWKEVYKGQTIGYKRLVRLAPTTASKVRINILASQDVPVLNQVGVYKADTAIELESDNLDGLKLIDDQNVGTGIDQIQFEGTWDNRTSEEGFVNNSSHWTHTAGAKATVRFKGSKFYFVTAVDQNHGTYEMKIDGEEPIIVDTYTTGGYAPKQLVYESEDLAYGEHIVELTSTGKNPHGGGTAVHLDAFYVLDNEKGLIEMAADEIRVKESEGKVEIPVRRVGGSKGEVSVSFSLLSGSAVEGKDFQRMVEDVVFEDGQTEGIAYVVLFDNAEEDGTRSFNVSISRVVGTVSGNKKKTAVHIIDDETRENLAFMKKATASSSETNTFTPDKATDGDREGTRWASDYTDDQWIEVDLGQEYTIDQVNLKWEGAFGKEYKIMTSLDGENYTEAYHETNGSAGLREITFEPVNARYVKMQGIQRGSKYGYSIYEFEVYEVSNEEEENSFVDICKDDYYYEAVLWADKEGIVHGIDDTHFAPAMRASRADVVTFLWRANGSPKAEMTETVFEDVVAGSYYYDAFLWAVEEGITAGVDETHFAPDRIITRAEFVTLFHRAEGEPASESENPFCDVADDMYYYDAVMWAAEKGITLGTEEGFYRPYETCTRGQAVTFLYRAKDLQ